MWWTLPYSLFLQFFYCGISSFICLTLYLVCQSVEPSDRILNHSLQIHTAALMSLSSLAPQCGHVHTRSDNLRDSFLVPHFEHVFEDGYHLSIFTNWRLYFSDLYSIIFKNVPHEHSWIDAARWWFFSIHLMFKDSKTRTPFSLINSVDNSCWKLLRILTSCS